YTLRRSLHRLQFELEGLPVGGELAVTIMGQVELRLPDHPPQRRPAIAAQPLSKFGQGRFVSMGQPEGERGIQIAHRSSSHCCAAYSPMSRAESGSSSTPRSCCHSSRCWDAIVMPSAASSTRSIL